MDPSILFLSLSPPLHSTKEISRATVEKRGGITVSRLATKVTKVSIRYLPITLDNRYLSFFFLFFFFFFASFYYLSIFLDFRGCFRSFLLKKKKRKKNYRRIFRGTTIELEGAASLGGKSSHSLVIPFPWESREFEFSFFPPPQRFRKTLQQFVLTLCTRIIII